MSKLKFSDKSANKRSKIKTELSIISFIEDGVYIIYSPALDLSGYGHTETEAKESFQIALQEFIYYCLNQNTLLDELENLGWTIKGSKNHPQITSPELSSLLKRNPDLEAILKKKEYHKYNQSIDLPVSA